MIDLSGSVVLVTGAGGGIGAGICDAFLESGANVIGAYRSSTPDRLESAAFAHLQADLTAPDSPRWLIAQSTARFGRLDALVNNAAIQDLAALDTMTDAQWQAVIDTNLTAVHRLTAAAMPALARTRGSVVHIASIEGRTPAPMHAHYAVSKAALIIHAKAAALEHGPKGVRVNSVSPGLIDRDGLEDAWPEGVERWRATAPLGRLGSPADVANACVFLCSPLAQWITGVDLVVDGGVSTSPHW